MIHRPPPSVLRPPSAPPDCLRSYPKSCTKHKASSCRRGAWRVFQLLHSTDRELWMRILFCHERTAHGTSQILVSKEQTMVCPVCCVLVHLMLTKVKIENLKRLTGKWLQ